MCILKKRISCIVRRSIVVDFPDDEESCSGLGGVSIEPLQVLLLPACLASAAANIYETRSAATQDGMQYVPDQSRE